MFKQAIKNVYSFFGYGKPKIIKHRKHNLNLEKISIDAIKICERLQKAGFSSYIVGGAIRDIIIGIAPKDFDITTNAKPEQIKSLFRKAYIIGKRFKLVHVRLGRELIEISTFRTSSLEKDNFGRILADNSFGSQEDDASRRDFTINSLYYNPLNHEIIDYYGGLKDLQNRTIKIIGNAEERYREDPVRMLRAIRLSSKIKGQLEKNTSEQINILKNLIRNVPQARLFDELTKILTCSNSFSCLKILNEKKILDNLVPSLNDTFKDKEAINFLKTSLEDTDRRILEGKHISINFLLAVILWRPVKSLWKKISNEQNNSIVSMIKSSEYILEEQARTIRINKRINIDSKEIWILQAKMEAKKIKSYNRICENPKFKAACDFMQLRAKTGEVDKNLAEWWVIFSESNEQNRKNMIKTKQTEINRSKLS